jgi:hypothetical protein
VLVERQNQYYTISLLPSGHTWHQSRPSGRHSVQGCGIRLSLRLKHRGLRLAHPALDVHLEKVHPARVVEPLGDVVQRQEQQVRPPVRPRQVVITMTVTLVTHDDHLIIIIIIIMITIIIIIIITIITPGPRLTLPRRRRWSGIARGPRGT